MKTWVKIALAGMMAVWGAGYCMALTGKWRGDLKVGAANLSLVFNFREDASGETVATMDSPQQNAKDIPLDVKHCTADSIAAECKMIGASYAARIEGNKITGTFIQNGFRLPLTLEPEADPLSSRPQTPGPPYPYTEKDTMFYSTDGTPLSGTLTLPADAPKGGVPVVVMVTGSGPQNRDEELFGHRPFAVIADYLARNGIASFRYDDRGVASSGGNFQEATLETFKADAGNALDFVRTLSRFRRYGMLGHSEGGSIAVLVGAESNPDFIVSMAGVSVPFRDVLIAQNIHSLDRAGITEIQKEATVRLLDILFDRIKEQYAAGVSIPLDVDSICREESLDVPAMVLESVKRSMSSRNAYFDNLVSFDPTECLRLIKCPVLAINGAKDTQVDCSTNLDAFSSNVKDIETRRMEGLNHLMQHAATGEAAEYGEIKETISPEVLEIIADFIRRK